MKVAMSSKGSMGGDQAFWVGLAGLVESRSGTEMSWEVVGGGSLGGGLVAGMEGFLLMEMDEVSVSTEVERRNAEGFLSFSAARAAFAALAFSRIFSAAEGCLDTATATSADAAAVAREVVGCVCASCCWAGGLGSGLKSGRAA